MGGFFACLYQPKQRIMNKLIYEAPSVELFEVLVERGFAQSQLEDNGFEDGNGVPGSWE